MQDVVAWHDGIREDLVSGPFERDNNSTIWEWQDVRPDDLQIEILRSLATAKEVILRFDGRQYHRDVTVSAADKQAILNVLTAYDAMRASE